MKINLCLIAVVLLININPGFTQDEETIEPTEEETVVPTDKKELLQDAGLFNFKTADFAYRLS